MDPQRLRFVHALVLSLGLRPFFQLHPIKPCTVEDLRIFHSGEYIEFLSTVSHDKIVTGEVNHDHCCAFNVGPVKEGVDCTAFDGLMEYVLLVTGGSLEAARTLTNKYADIAINWAGGFHHAKRSNAAGFCYVNDCVIAIVELLKSFEKILYIDIDFHHGDGVEEAFYVSEKVCTVSFHRFGAKRVFPGTGDVEDIGFGPGEGYCVNFPLQGGIGDEAYVKMFKETIELVFDRFQPDAIVLQAGADSLAGDSVGVENGSFNLSTRAHAECVRIVRDLDRPLLVLGGGGYSKEAVARCWAIETAVLCGREKELPENIPENDFYYPQYREKNLHIESRKVAVDFNTPGRMAMIRDKIKQTVSMMEKNVVRGSR